MGYLSLLYWLTLYNLMMSSLIHCPGSNTTSFLVLSKTPLCIDTTFFFIHSFWKPGLIPKFGNSQFVYFNHIVENNLCVFLIHKHTYFYLLVTFFPNYLLNIHTQHKFFPWVWTKLTNLSSSFKHYCVTTYIYSLS